MNIIVKTEKINFVELVENSDPEKSLRFKSRMVDELTKEFSTDEQKWFIANLYMYLNYHSTDDYPIDLDNAWKFIGFSTKANAKKSLENNFILDEDYRISLIPRDERSNTKGGENKEHIMLNMDTLKHLSILVKTPEGKRNRIYHLKLEKMYNKLIKEDYIEYELKIKKQLKEKNSEIQQIKQESVYNIKLEKHNVLMDNNQHKKCVYIKEVESKNDDKVLVKVGSTKDLDTRNYTLKKEFGPGLFLDIFECGVLFRDIEDNIKDDIRVSKFKYKNPLDSGHVSVEVFVLSRDFTYQQLVTVVKDNIRISSNFLTPKEVLESKRLDVEKQRLDLITKCIESNYDIEKLTFALSQVPVVSESDLETKNFPKDQKDEPKPELVKVKNFGRKIQQIDKDNLTIVVKVYKDMQDLMYQHKHDTFSETGIRDAITDHKVYKKFRWMFIDNYLDQNVVHNISPTFEKKTGGCVTIYELNNEKTEILRHFNSFCVAVEYLKVNPHKARKIMKTNAMYNNKFYLYTSDCPKDSLEKYTKKVGDEIKYVPKSSIKIKAIDPNTKEEKIFQSLTHAHTVYKIHHKTVHRAIKDKRIVHGMYWEYVY
jgi:phage anti-repressor protein